MTTAISSAEIIGLGVSASRVAGLGTGVGVVEFKGSDRSSELRPLSLNP